MASQRRRGPSRWRRAGPRSRRSAGRAPLPPIVAGPAHDAKHREWHPAQWLARWRMWRVAGRVAQRRRRRPPRSRPAGRPGRRPTRRVQPPPGVAGQVLDAKHREHWGHCPAQWCGQSAAGRMAPRHRRRPSWPRRVDPPSRRSRTPPLGRQGPDLTCPRCNAESMAPQASRRSNRGCRRRAYRSSCPSRPCCCVG